MLTLVDQQNCAFFLPMLPGGAAEELARPGTLAYGLVEDGLACAAALGSFRTGTGAELRSLYVAKGCRRRGYATTLLRSMEAVARRCGLDGLEAVSHSSFDDVNRFLQAGGFAELSRSSVFTLPLGTLAASKSLAPAGEPSAAVVPVAALPAIEVRRLNRALQQEEAELPLAPMDRAAMDAQVSMAYAPGGKTEAFAWFSYEAGVLHMDGLVVDTREKAVLLVLLRRCLQAAAEKYPPDTRMQFTAINNLTDRMVRFFLKGLAYTEEAVIRYQLALPPA